MAIINKNNSEKWVMEYVREKAATKKLFVTIKCEAKCFSNRFKKAHLFSVVM